MARISWSRVERRHGVVVAAMCVVLVALLAAFAGLIRQSDARAYRALANGFETRAEVTGSFARSFVLDLAQREQAQAERLLAGEHVDQAAFETVTRAFGFEAAVLLDDRGRLLHVWPPKPELVGHDMTVDYAHLRAAVDGEIGVSEMVPSAARAVPVAAVATPYASALGRRVLSGAFSPSKSPLGAYLDSVVPVTGGSAHLVDASGDILAGSAADVSDRDLLARLPPGVTDVELTTGRATAAVADVDGLPWRVVLVAPTTSLYAPVAGQATSWALWAAVGAAGAAAIALFVRLGRARADAAMSARTDALTSLPNRRAMHEAVARSAALSERHDVPIAALMIDVDHFKRINDVHGHEAGDSVLRSIADVLVSATREGDVSGRWGGEEFLVLLPHADAGGAAVTAHRILARLHDAVVTPAGRPVTASVGIATIRDGDGDAMLRDADAALYLAKANGRDRVELFLAPAPDVAPILV